MFQFVFNKYDEEGPAEHAYKDCFLAYKIHSFMVMSVNEVFE